MKNSRRQFMILSAAGACAVALNGKVQAQPMVSDADPQAKALQYVALSQVAELAGAIGRDHGLADRHPKNQRAAHHAGLDRLG